MKTTPKRTSQTEPFKFSVRLRDAGREISDQDWEVIEPQYILAWNEIKSMYSPAKVSFEDETYTIRINLNPIPRRIAGFCKEMERFVQGAPIETLRFPRGGLKLSVKANIQGTQTERRAWRAATLTEYLLHECFLIMNLSAPGSCNFDASYVVFEPRTYNTHGGEIRLEINLSSHMFESLLDCKVSWLKPGFLDVSRVGEWVLKVLPRFQLLPNNPSAKALFALLHLARGHYGPPAAIWVFYALESLFDCKVGENFSILTRRISLLLRLTASQAKHLKKRLRELYDIRSGFVHGGIAVMHLIEDDSLDDRVESEILRLMHAVDFGVLLIVVSLQETIRREWDFPVFVEQLGTPPAPQIVSA